MTISIIHRTSRIYWRNGFLNSAASAASAAIASTCPSTCSRAVRTASSTITSSSNNSSGEQATQEQPNLTPDKSYNVLTRKKSEVCNLCSKNINNNDDNNNKSLTGLFDFTFLHCCTHSLNYYCLIGFVMI